MFLRKWFAGSIGRGLQAEECVSKASGEGSVSGQSSAGALVPALPAAPSVPWTSPFPSQGLSFHIWRKKHQSSVLRDPTHVSLVWDIGRLWGTLCP